MGTIGVVTRSDEGRPRRFARPVVADPLVRPVAVVVVVCMIGLAALALRFGGTTTAGRTDTRAEVLVQTWVGQYADTLRYVVRLGDARNVVAAALVLAVVCLLLGRPRLALVAVAGPAVTGVVTTVLQPVIGRTIEGGYALPSGHAGGLTAVATVLGLLAITSAHERLRSTGLVALCGVVLAGFVMAVALVVNDEHYWTDTVAGSCAAVAVVCGLALLVDLVFGRTAPVAGRPAGRPRTDGRRLAPRAEDPSDRP